MDINLFYSFADGMVHETDMYFEGDVIGPTSYTVFAEFSSSDTRESDTASLVVLGNRIWKRVETESWIATDPQDPVVVAMQQTIDPSRTLNASPTALARIAAGLDATQERVNGIDALRFDIAPTITDLQTPVPQEFTDTLFGDGKLVGDSPFSMTYWVTPNYQRLLRLEVEARLTPGDGGTLFGEAVPEDVVVDYYMAVDITRHNDPTIDIRPPTNPISPLTS